MEAEGIPAAEYGLLAERFRPRHGAARERADLSPDSQTLRVSVSNPGR